MIPSYDRIPLSLIGLSVNYQIMFVALITTPVGWAETHLYIIFFNNIRKPCDEFLVYS